MNKEDRYSNRMSLPKDGMTLAKNDDILLRAVSEGQKDYMFRVFRKQEYILFWSRKMKKLNIYKLCWRSYDFDEFELRRFIVRSRVCRKHIRSFQLVINKIMSQQSFSRLFL